MAISLVEEMAAVMPDASHLLSDEPEMESTLHYVQLALLVATLKWWWRDRSDFFIGANLSIYFSRQQLKTRDFRGPDFFLVRDTHNEPRTSWVVWEEGGKYPDLIIELLSASTEEIDRTIKLDIYQERFRTPEYFWFSPETLEFKGHRLVDGHYQEVLADERGWRWSSVMGLYLGVEAGALRYFTPEGELVPTPEETALRELQRAQQAVEYAEQATALAQQAAEHAEQAIRHAEQETQRAEQATQRAEQEAQRAEQETQRAARLAAKLIELGINPDRLS